jgi:hypothetical protein
MPYVSFYLNIIPGTKWVAANIHQFSQYGDLRKNASLRSEAKVGSNMVSQPARTALSPIWTFHRGGSGTVANTKINNGMYVRLLKASQLQLLKIWADLFNKCVTVGNILNSWRQLTIELLCMGKEAQTIQGIALEYCTFKVFTRLSRNTEQCTRVAPVRHLVWVQIWKIDNPHIGKPAHWHHSSIRTMSKDSTNFSIIIITRGWNNRPLSGRSVKWTLFPPPTMQIKKKLKHTWFSLTVRKCSTCWA